MISKSSKIADFEDLSPPRHQARSGAVLGFLLKQIPNQFLRKWEIFLRRHFSPSLCSTCLFRLAAMDALWYHSAAATASSSSCSWRSSTSATCRTATALVPSKFETNALSRRVLLKSNQWKPNMSWYPISWRVVLNKWRIRSRFTLDTVEY